MSRPRPFSRHQHQVAKWQPSAHLFGRELWRALVRHARDRDTEEKRGRAPVTAVVTVVPVRGDDFWAGWIRFFRNHVNHPGVPNLPTYNRRFPS